MFWCWLVSSWWGILTVMYFSSYECFSKIHLRFLVNRSQKCLHTIRPTLFPFLIPGECDPFHPCSKPLPEFFEANSSTHTPHKYTYFLLDLTSPCLSLLLGPLRLSLSFPPSSRQHLILFLVCPQHFPALGWQTVEGLLKVARETLDRFHQGFPGGRLIGKVIYCTVSHLQSRLSLHFSCSIYLFIPLHLCTNPYLRLQRKGLSRSDSECSCLSQTSCVVVLWRSAYQHTLQHRWKRLIVCE